MTVISGGHSEIEAFEKILSEQGIQCRRLHTSHAFHSQMMEPMLEGYAKIVNSLERHPPVIPFVSNMTGSWITDSDATSAEYWANHIRQPVRYHSCINTLMEGTRRIFIEVGPGQVLSMLARQNPRSNNHAVIASTRRPVERRNDISVLLNTLGQLWLEGLEIDWNGFYQYESRNKTPLPGYVFQRKRFWIDSPSSIGENTNKFDSEQTKQAHQPPVTNEISTNTLENNNEYQIRSDIVDVISDSTGMPREAFAQESTFSDLGIDSLQLTAIASKLTDKFGVPVLFRDISIEFHNSLLLAEHIKKLLRNKIDSKINNEKIATNKYCLTSKKIANIISIQPNGDKTPFILVHGDDADHLLPKYFDNDQPIFGFLHQGADGEPMQYKRVEEVAKYYTNQLLETKPSPSYIICGFSFGGLVAYEMASTLLKLGHDIPLLIMLDAYNPGYIKPIEIKRRIRNLIKHPINSINNLYIDLLCRYYILKGIQIPAQFRNKYILSIYDFTGIFLYKPKPISCPVLLLKAKDTDYDEPNNGWSSLISGKFSTEIVPGNHLTMMRTPGNFEKLANILLNNINELHN
jgi:thioesterase domain-containing protein/acyl carrier protein